MAKPMIELVDCKIINIDSYESYSPGCETCDYGSSYTREFTITFEDDKYIEISKSESYEYPMSLQDIMVVLLNHIDYIKSLTCKEFAKWIYLAMCKQTEKVLKLVTDVLNGDECDELDTIIEDLELTTEFWHTKKDFKKLVLEGYELDE